MQLIELIKDSTEGNKQSSDELFTFVYEDLRSLARKIRFDWRNEHTLNTPALVHEAYLKVCQSSALTSANKLHFYRICGRAMRYILSDYIKHKSATKRGGQAEVIALNEQHMVQLSETAEPMVAELLAKIDQLKTHDPLIADVIDCRFFANMTVVETSKVLEVSPATVKRKWAFARSYISSDLSQSA